LHRLDGVNVDLEWDGVTTGYSDFAIELKKSLIERKKITAALPNNSQFENINSAALNAFNFINIMAYDSTGLWSLNKAERHSSFEFAKQVVDFWHKLQNVPADRLTLGVPFYGYNFTYPEVTSSAFSQILDVGTQFADQDELGKIFYNGRVTIAQKVGYAPQNTGGIMIWQLAQDSFGEYFLLDVIHEKYTALKVKTTGLCGN